jgi:hypothetical protein
VGIQWSPSAGKHGIDRLDAIAVMSSPLHQVERFDEPRIPGGAASTLFIGLSRGGRMLEVLAVLTPPADVFVFHVMALRPEIAARAGFYQEED